MQLGHTNGVLGGSDPARSSAGAGGAERLPAAPGGAAESRTRPVEKARRPNVNTAEMEECHQGLKSWCAGDGSSYAGPSVARGALHARGKGATSSTCSSTRSLRMVARTALPTRAATGPPPKVLKYSMPLAKARASGAVVTTPARGNPLPAGLPNVTMSGATPLTCAPQQGGERSATLAACCARPRRKTRLESPHVSASRTAEAALDFVRDAHGAPRLRRGEGAVEEGGRRHDVPGRGEKPLADERRRLRPGARAAANHAATGGRHACRCREIVWGGLLLGRLPPSHHAP